MLGAETEGMIGYVLEQELGNLLPFDVPFATILTMIEVDRADPAFDNPTKFVGPSAQRSTGTPTGWQQRKAGSSGRMATESGAESCPSPLPKRIFELRPIKWLPEHGTIVICAGGGGIPTAYAEGDGSRTLGGVEAVIDKDLASELLARGTRS